MRTPWVWFSIVFGLLGLCAAPASGQSTALENDSNYIYRSLQQAAEFPDRVFRLNLSRQKLDSIPEVVYSFVNLRELDLSRNKLQTVSPRLGELVFLERLNLSNNELTGVPDEIGRLRKLRNLSLNRNRIVRLPQTIGELEALEVFELWDNELEEVPEEISRLQNLRLLELRGILFTQEEQTRIDQLVVKSAKVNMSPSCNCK